MSGGLRIAALLGRGAGVLLLAWLGLVGTAWHLQERLLFPGAFQLADDPATVASLVRGLERVGGTTHTLTTSDGVDLLAWHLPAGTPRLDPVAAGASGTPLPNEPGDREAPAGLVLYVGGNAERLDGAAPLGRMLQRRGIDLLAVALRGFPGSQGAPGAEGFVEDVHTAWRFATQVLGVPPARIVLHGRSMGGGVVGEALAELQPAGVVMESTFDDLAAVASHHQPWLPVRGLLRHRLAPARVTPTVTAPVLQLHSATDRVVPVAAARRLAAAWPEVTLRIHPAGQHDDHLFLAVPQIRDTWARFLEEALSRPVTGSSLPPSSP